MTNFKVSVEAWIALLSLALMVGLSAVDNLPILIPTGARAAFLGLHYLYPLAALAVLGMVTCARGTRDVISHLLIAIPCFAVVLFCHFNVKLWIPHINPVRYDHVYWAIDQRLSFLVDACEVIRTRIFGFIPYEANFYLLGYMAMFYISFLYHGLKTPQVFRLLIVSALILQLLGTVAYLVAPAVGPFIYETGVSPVITASQQRMLEFYRESVALGTPFLKAEGGDNFVIGLAAMPSLHSASAFLFFLFAWRHARPLVPLYAILLVYILVTAIAARWHYLIDLPVGLLLALAAYRLADLVLTTKVDGRFGRAPLPNSASI